MAESSSSGFSSWAPIIGSAVDAVGGFLGGIFNANQAKKNRQFQERMYFQQLADNKEMLEDARRYALPSAELQRIKDAGLNPLLYYGQNGASANLTPAPAAQAPHGAQAQMSMHTNFGQALLQSQLVQAQIRNIDADTAQKQAAANESGARTKGFEFLNWLNDQTAKIQVALKFRDFDYVNQMIDESRNRIFQSSFVNANEMASLALQNSLAIRRQNLAEYQVGENVKQGWEAVISGRMSASAQVKSAAAAMMQAVNAAQLVPYQIGVLRNDAARLFEVTETEKQMRPHRVIELKKKNAWTDFINSENILNDRQKRELIQVQGENVFQETQWVGVKHMMSPFNALVGFGAGYATKGASGSSMNGYSPSYSY